MCTTPYDTQRKYEILHLYINGRKIERVRHTRFLGVVIDDELSWEHHIEELRKKLLSSLVAIKRIYKFIPKNQYKTLYHTLFESNLVYCISAWGGIPPYRLAKLFSVQKRCLRLLFGETYSYDHAEFYETCARVRTYEENKKAKQYALESTKPLFTKHKFLTVHNLHHLHTVVELFKIMKFCTPHPLFHLMKFTGKTSSFSLRIPVMTYETFKTCFVYQSSYIWNKVIEHVLDPVPLSEKNIIIPGSTANSDLNASVAIFKSRVRKLLFDMQQMGHDVNWDNLNRNFDAKNIAGPCWTWGAEE